jgi:hypothetical protein
MSAVMAWQERASGGSFIREFSDIIQRKAMAMSQKGEAWAY